MKKDSNISKTEDLLKEYAVLKDIYNNSNTSQEQRNIVLYNVNNIELALKDLNKNEIEIITLKYFSGLKNIDVANQLNLTPEYICTRSKLILNKLNRCIAIQQYKDYRAISII